MKSLKNLGMEVLSGLKKSNNFDQIVFQERCFNTLQIYESLSPVAVASSASDCKVLLTVILLIFASTGALPKPSQNCPNQTWILR